MEDKYNELIADGTLDLGKALEITKAFLYKQLSMYEIDEDSIAETLLFAWYDAYGAGTVIDNDKDWASRTFTIIKKENPGPRYYDSIDDPDFVEQPVPENDEPYMTRQELCYRLWHERGMKQVKIAKDLGVRPETVCRWIADWERGMND